MSDHPSTRQPRPSIYVRVMPLMYGLIGAAAALFLHALFCGRLGRLPDDDCKPVKSQTAAAASTPRTAVTAAISSSPDGSGQPARPAHVRPMEAPRTPRAKLPSPTPRAKRPSPAPQSVEGRLTTTIAPCVRSQARSFRLAVRLHPDGKVRRVFVARDPGVNATMTACIQRQLAATSLPLKLPRGGYAEWRVRQVDRKLSLTLIRPARLRRR